MPVTAVAADAQAVDDSERQRKPVPAGGTIFSRRYGPLPGWAWSLIIAGGVLGYYLWRQHSAAATDTGATDSMGASTDVPVDDSGTLAALQSEIQALQGTAAQDLTTDTQDLALDTPKPHTPRPKAPTRHQSKGGQSLAQIARERHTTVAHLIAVTRAAPINKTNRAKFNAYVKRGTGHKMPAGLVYYTSN